MEQSCRPGRDVHAASPSYNNCWGAGSYYVKMAHVTSPAMTFYFLEDADWRGYNKGTYVLHWDIARASFTWIDPPAMYHGSLNTCSFADGHAETHKWLDGLIITAGQQAASGIAVTSFPGPASGPDYSYVRERYRHPNWR